MLEVRDRKQHGLNLLGETYSKLKFVLRGDRVGWGGKGCYG